VKIAALRKQAQDGEGAATAAKQRIDEQISEIIGRTQRLNADKAKFTAKATQETRIKELADREKELAGQYEELQRGLALCDDFTRTKSEIISKNICAKFRTVSFRFFRNQVNGGLDECCDVLVPTDNSAIVPFDYANNAAQVVAGIEIIDILSDLWSVSLPLILDGSESVTPETMAKVKDVKIQIISLFVNRADTALRTEIKKGDNRYVA
jgi:hypothetical protein